MDRLTQLADGVDELVTIMHTTLEYLSHKSTFRQLDSAYRISQVNPAADDLVTFEELVTQLLKKAKQVEYLCDAAPCPAPKDPDFGELRPLEAELKLVNAEYLAAVAEAERLQGELNSFVEMLMAKRPS